MNKNTDNQLASANETTRCSNKMNSIEETLEYCGIDKNDTHKQVAYHHASKLLQLFIIFEGKPAKETLNKARLYVGINERYINEYYCSFLSWGIIALKGNTVKYVGIPEEQSPQSEESIDEANRMKYRAPQE